MQEELNGYFCRRYAHEENEDWWGALIIAAQTEGEAFKIFCEKEHPFSPRPPEKIEGVFANGTSRVIYDYSLEEYAFSPSLEDISHKVTTLFASSED